MTYPDGWDDDACEVCGGIDRHDEDCQYMDSAEPNRCAGGCGSEVAWYGDVCGECACEDDGALW